MKLFCPCCIVNDCYNYTFFTFKMLKNLKKYNPRPSFVTHDFLPTTHDLSPPTHDLLLPTLDPRLLASPDFTQYLLCSKYLVFKHQSQITGFD